jgi:FdhD protein
MQNSPERKKAGILSRIETLPILNWNIQQWDGENVTELTDRVVIEEPFELRINGRALAAIMRTPGNGIESDRELALGFLLTEGIIANPAEVTTIVRARDADGLPAENAVNVQMPQLPPGFFGKDDGEGRFERRFTVASSCGLCGKNSIAEVCRRLPPLPPDDIKISPEIIYSLPNTLRAAQDVFDSTGGLHAAGLFHADGKLRLLREDIGRHNAVDKVIGRMALNGEFPLSQHILLVSGRISFEIVQKALAARIPVIAAVSAPSSLALDLAAEAGITLIGFLRGRRFNVYNSGQRIQN